MDEPESPKKRLFTGLRIVLLFGLLVCGFIGYLRFYANQHTAAGNQQVLDNLATLDTMQEKIEKTTAQHEERIRNLEEAVQKLASAPAAPAASPPATAEAAPPTPPAAAGNPGATPAPLDDARIAALEKEIAALKASQPQSPESVGQAIRLLSAFHRFSDKVLNGKPFSAELTAFEELAKPDESSGSPVSTLAPFADSGIPTFATLLTSFDQAVDSLNAELAVPPADAAFSERLKYNLTHMVTVRRIDEAQAGNSEQAIVGRAQSHLEREEIEAAMAEIKSLPETARGNFASWLEDAQLVTDAPSLIDQLDEQVMQKAFHADASAAPATPAPAAAPSKPAEPVPPPQTPKP